MNHGYSDRVNHALAFVAKYATPQGRRGSGLAHLTHPAHVAIILARHDCDEVTTVAGILSYLVNTAVPTFREPIERKICEKFGPVVTAVVKEVAEPRYDSRGRERTWEVCRMDYLANLAGAEPRALEVCTANQIHLCGSILADVRRLGVEYLSTFSSANAEQTLWWYRSVLEAIEAQAAGPRPAMLAELRDLSGQLALVLEGER